MALIRASAIRPGMLANGKNNPKLSFSIFRKNTPFCNVNGLNQYINSVFLLKYMGKNELKQLQIMGIT